MRLATPEGRESCFSAATGCATGFPAMRARQNKLETSMEHVWNVRLGAALVVVSSLAACGGGGGGGGGAGGAAPAGGLILPNEGAPVAATALSANKVEAAGPSVLDTLLGAVVFPLYPLRSTAVAEGTRTQTSDGSLTITYRSSTGPRSFTFAPSEFTSSTSEGFIAEKAATNPAISTLYSEFWADAAQGWKLDYSRLGTFFFWDSGSQQVQLFYFGAETPSAQMPVSSAPNLGTAQYDGKTSGYVFGANPSTLNGDVRLLLNFATDRFTGVITNLTTEGATGGAQPLGVSFVVDNAADDARITREAIGGSITGKIAAVNDTTNARISCCGNIVGRFFGPNAKELTGGWLYDVNDLSIRAVFGTTRDTTQILDPGAVIAVNTTQRADTAPGVSFPLYSLTAIDGIRTQTATGLTLVYADQGFPVSLPFVSANIATAGGVTTATRSDAVWREFGTVDASSPSGALAYSRFGHLNATNATSPRDRFFAFGYETPVASIPITGRAEYFGSTTGTYTSGATVESLSGLVNLVADFAEGELSGRISALTITGSGGTSRALGQIAVIQGDILENNANGSHFTAALNPTTNNGVLTGRFYGPGLEEAAGVWSMAVGSDLAQGSFGTRSTVSTHPSGAAALTPWTGSTATSFLSNDVVIRAVYATVGSVPTITNIQTLSTASPVQTALRPEADGGITWRFGANPQITLPGDAFDTRTSAFTTPYPVMQTRQVADEDDFAMHVAGEGFLSYARFGYWEDSTANTLQPTIGFFASGRETPLAQMPTSGIATYTGATLGMGLSNAGLARLSGALSMTVNFDTRTMSGEITNLRADYLATAPGAAPGNTFAISTLRMSTLNIVGSGFTGPAGGFVGSGPGETAVASGTMTGQFFGPQAQEIAGKWEVQSPEVTPAIRAWGAFGATR